MSRLRIGLDIDSVIADTATGWNAYYRTQANICQGNFDAHWRAVGAPVTHWDYHSDICKTCFYHVLHDRERIMELVPHRGASIAIQHLAENCDLYVLTSRPEPVHKHTIAWLQQYNLYQYLQDVIFTHAKADDAALLQLDYHLEDAPHHIAAIRERGDTVPLIFDTPYNKDEVGIRLDNWSEVDYFLSAVVIEHFFESRSLGDDEAA